MQETDNQLNKRERYKARMRPYEYFEHFETLDFESLSEGDRFYLQDFGIFNTDFLEDEFTMRLRIPGGRISAEQFSHISDMAIRYNLHIILTARGGIQLHGLESENILDIFRQINTLGLTTWQSFGDNIRNIVSDVYDGRGANSEIEVYPLIMQMQEYILKNPEYVGMLPRRISIGISGNRANVTSFFANDIYFALAKKDECFGFNVYMGGKNTEVAQDADIFLKTGEVLDFFKAFVETFNLYGSRTSRSKNRLFYLIEEIGIDALKQHIQSRYKNVLQNRGTPMLEKKEFLPNERLKDGTYAYCYQTDFARINTCEIKQLSEYATKHGAEIRIGIDQNIYLLGLKDTGVPFASPKESATVVACAGSLCPYSFWNIKNETSYLPLAKINEHKIQVGFSGCAKGCGRHQHTDIGLIGLKTNSFGNTQGGARVFVGAEHSYGRSVGRMLFAMVPLEHLHELLSLMILMYEKSGCGDFEEYSHKVLNTFSEEFLAMWYLANLQSSLCLALEANRNSGADAADNFANEKRLLEESFPKSDFSDLIGESFSSAVSVLSKQLWTIEGKDSIYKPPVERTVFR
ncbi:nitrite/sulfite reductase [bacterium]|nr:nitrite/sulfite reductase [bacterium]MBU1989934.1 nitrite/sulfite reductase [bacterium]